jgi:hypothetical protein
MFEQNEIESLRHSFRPGKIATLFVGESAPVSGKFFYAGNTNFYRFVKQAFGGDDDFLNAFKGDGFFLDDLVQRPVNALSRTERRRLHREYMPSLAQRIASYQPQAVISVMKDIHEVVAGAITSSKVANITHYKLPFPGQSHQTRFVAELRRIRPKLPTNKAP